MKIPPGGGGTSHPGRLDGNNVNFLLRLTPPGSLAQLVRSRGFRSRKQAPGFCTSQVLGRTTQARLSSKLKGEEWVGTEREKGGKEGGGGLLKSPAVSTATQNDEETLAYTNLRRCPRYPYTQPFLALWGKKKRRRKKKEKGNP